MIDLTPLDVRNKRGDFKKNLRGYDAQEVDTFLELAAERLEQLVMENLRLRERTDALQSQVESQSGREKAVQEALVTAQELRSEMRGQAERESEIILAEARAEARRIATEAETQARTLLRDAERRLEEGTSGLEELERRRKRFLRSYRQLLEREMDVVLVEEERAPLEETPIELDLLGGLAGAAEAEPRMEAVDAVEEVDAVEVETPDAETLDAEEAVSSRVADGSPPAGGEPSEPVEAARTGGLDAPAGVDAPEDRPRATLGADGEIHWDQDPLVGDGGETGGEGALDDSSLAGSGGALGVSDTAADVRELIERLDAIRGLVETGEGGSGSPRDESDRDDGAEPSSDGSDGGSDSAGRWG